MKTKNTAVTVAASLLSISAIAATSPSPEIFDEVMAQTVGQYSLGGTTMNYMVSGQLIYGYGFDGLDSGFHHSHLDLSTSTSIRHGIDVTFNTGVRDIYDLRDDDYETKADVSLKLSKDNHDLKVGYDKNIANKILGNKMKMNGDTSLSKNAIGQKFSGYDAFVEYNYAVQNYILITSADFDGNLYSGLSVYANDFDVKIHVFEHQDDFNVFFDVGTVIGEQIKTSLGFGLNQEKLSFIADGSYFVTDTLNLYGNVLGDEDYSTATVGAEYVYGSFAAYAEGVVALTSPKVSGQSQDGVLLGAKFMF